MRSRNLQTLTADIATAYPGVVIYGVGDDAHKLHSSDHNEDDTSGSRAAQSDSDAVPEHRAIDVMIGPAMTRAQLQGLVDRLVADPGARVRLFYIIFDGWIWSRSTGWVKKPKLDDPHRGHAHISGWAADDENPARWPAVTVNRKDDEDMFCAQGESNEKVRAMQIKVVKAGGHVGPVDATGKPVPHPGGSNYHYCTGTYDANTARGLGALVGNNGTKYTAWEHAALDDALFKARMRELGGVAKGDPGPAGKTPTKVRIAGALTAEVVEYAP